MNLETYDDVKSYFMQKKHRELRRNLDANLAEQFEKLGFTAIERMTRRFEFLCKEEKPIVFLGERIAFLRTIINLPDIFTQREWKQIKAIHYIHESGFLSNLSPDYEKILKSGISGLANDADAYSIRSIIALSNLARRYVSEAEKVGNKRVAYNIKHIINHGAESFEQALQLFRIVHFGLWLEGNYHITVGCFDRYMYPYYKKDIDSGIITKEDAYSLLEEFFLSFNKDSDLYFGVQQGDNGQSLVLGGIDADGKEVFNDLSQLCLKASGALMLIDPKINLRVSKKTPIEVFEKGTVLTRKGMGFPQYTNDDIAIPALEKLGYSYKDACEYAIAACWELIIPKYGADVANISALSFAKVIDICLHRDLVNCATFDEFVKSVKKEITTQCNEIEDSIKNIWFVPSPLMNVCMACNVESGGKYNNFGIHGTGLATAADSLSVIKKYVYIEKSITKKELISAVDNDFAGYEDILYKCRYEAPKVGQNDDFVDGFLVDLLQSFSDSLKTKTNCRGGVYRAGTGSAMYYLWHVKELGASPDGRRKGEPLGTNFSPSLFAKAGVFSVIASLTKPNFTDAFNGGPVTLEFSDSIWQAQDSINKFAKFIKAYIEMGGHQIQLNSVNLETLKAAQKNPTEYQRLIVRIWGWSAYFVELDKAYQDHVIARQEYKL